MLLGRRSSKAGRQGRVGIGQRSGPGARHCILLLLLCKIQAATAGFGGCVLDQRQRAAGGCGCGLGSRQHDTLVLAAGTAIGNGRLWYKDAGILQPRRPTGGPSVVIAPGRVRAGSARL